MTRKAKIMNQVMIVRDSYDMIDKYLLVDYLIRKELEASFGQKTTYY